MLNPVRRKEKLQRWSCCRRDSGTPTLNLYPSYCHGFGLAIYIGPRISLTGCTALSLSSPVSFKFNIVKSFNNLMAWHELQRDKSLVWFEIQSEISSVYWFWVGNWFYLFIRNGKNDFKYSITVQRPIFLFAYIFIRISKGNLSFIYSSSGQRWV